MSRIVFFGNERIATGVTTSVPTLQKLISAGHEVVAIVSNYEVATSRKSRELEIQKVAEAHNIPVLLPNKPTDIIQQLKDLKAEIAVLVAYGKIVPQSVIDIFPGGIVNVHPSLLPLHRGPIPIESVILNGELKTGVSIMKLAKAMDAGPVYAQSEIVLLGNETKQQLADELLEIGGSMVAELLPEIINGEVVAIDQDEERATYDQLIAKQDGTTDWNKSAQQLEREVRAYMGWPASTTQLAGKDVALTKVSLSSVEGKPGKAVVAGKELFIHCAEGSLKVERLKPSGKNEMTSEAFLAGHKHLL